MRNTEAAVQHDLAALASEVGTRPGKPVREERLSSIKDEGVCVFNRSREAFLSLNVTRADTHFTRLKGLLGRTSLRSGEGLWTIPSQGIHTFCLLFPIDLVYLDSDNRVVHLIEDLRPFRIAPIRLDAASVLQFRTRTIYASGTQVGDELLLCAPDEIASLCKQKETARR